MLLNMVEQGQGDPVCLLHGLFGRLQNLAALARRLAATRRVISLDLRNHGASPHAADMSYAAMAGDVMETLSAQGALPASLLGHSMGGKVAMLAALSQPLLVSRLIVADIAPIAYSHHNARVAAALLALDLSPGLDRQRAAAALEADVPDPAVRGFLLQNLEFGGAPRWKIGLHQIAAGIAGIEGWPNLPDRLIYRGPALFLAGGKSDYVPPACVPAITARFPRAVLQVLDGAGHWLHAEQPAAFGDAVENFLAAEHSDTSF